MADPIKTPELDNPEPQPPMDYNARYDILQGAPINPNFSMEDHFTWARNMQSQGKEAEARENLRKSRFTDSQIDASFLPQKYMKFHKYVGETPVGEERERRAASTNLEINKLMERREEAIANRRRLSQNQPEDDGTFAADTPLFTLTQRIEGYNREIQELGLGSLKKLAQRFQSDVNVLSQPVIWSNPELQEQQDEFIQEALTVLKMLSPHSSVGWDDDADNFTIDGEPVTIGVIDWMISNANYAIATGAGLGLAGAGGNAYLNVKGGGQSIKAATDFAGKAKRVAGTIGKGVGRGGLFGLGIAAGAAIMSEAELADTKRALNTFGMVMRDRAANTKQSHDFILGLVGGGVGAAAGRVLVYGGYALKGGAAGIDKVGEQAGKIDLGKLSSEYVKRMKDSNNPVRDDALIKLKEVAGITDEKKFKEGMDAWVETLSEKGETFVSVNEFGSFGKVALSAGFRDAVKPSRIQFNSLTPNEQEALYLLHNSNKVMNQMAKVLNDNYGLPTATFVKSAAERQRVIKDALGDDKLSLDDLSQINIDIDNHVDGIWRQMSRTWDKSLAQRIPSNDIKMPKNLRGKEVAIDDLIHAWIEEPLPHYRRNLRQVIGAFVEPKLLSSYKEAIDLATKGLGATLRKTDDAGQAVAALQRYALETNVRPDYRILTGSIKDPARLQRVEAAIIESEILSNSVGANTNYVAVYNRLKGVGFKTDKAQKIYERVRVNAYLDRNDVEFVSRINSGFPHKTRIGAGFATTPEGRLKQKVVSAGAHFTETHIPGTTKHAAIGFENIGLRFFTEDPVSQRSIKYADALIRDAQGATK